MGVLSPVRPLTDPALERLRPLLCGVADGCIVTMGTFDGVHRGHRALLAEARALARERGVRCVAVTFAPRPDACFAPEPVLPDVCSVDERVARLQAAGADEVVVLPFDRDVAAVEHEPFMLLLREELGMQALVVGEDFAVGRARRGMVDVLRATGLEVVAHPLVPNGAGTAKASSTSVRRAVAAGVEPAAALDAA